MIKAIIIDDEDGARKTLLALLKQFCPNVQVLGDAASASEAREIIKKINPNLIFLDIRMPFENGFDLLESLKEKKFQVIFTTAYNNYALKAIKFSALDYLLKPINVAELQKAVEKSANTPIYEEQYTVFNAHKTNQNDEQIVLPFKDGFRVVNCREIVRFEGARNYSWVYFITGNRLLIAKTLKEFEELLTELDFLRIHQSHLINLKCVSGYRKGRGGEVDMIDGSIVELARSRKKQFLSKFED